ncbi:hypothetical protein HAX54_023009 [Datura stramonium]|uniref:Secreted protein n=1 Tax=Datura stramonium TaxID=4076 RepID=A0ABS8UW80_DATST|nr:hypothetical protein [Datura stramonium]
MLYKAKSSIFIFFFLFSIGFLFPIACSTRMDKTMMARDLRQTSAIISHRKIFVPVRISPPSEGTGR